MKRRIRFLTLLVLLLVPFIVAADDGYRVSGVIGQENRWLLAVIEDPSGKCRMYAPGDPLDGGTVVEITPQGVLVKFGNEVRLLKLEGSSFIAAAETTESAGSSTIPPLTGLRSIYLSAARAYKSSSTRQARYLLSQKWPERLRSR